MPVDYSEYPPNWHSEIRPRILERAGHRCEECGVANYAAGYRDDAGKFIPVEPGTREGEMDLFGEPLPVIPPGRKEIRIVLTIAHLDRDPENWAVTDDRLRALCQRCHLHFDRSDNIRRRQVREEQEQAMFTGRIF